MAPDLLFWLAWSNEGMNFDGYRIAAGVIQVGVACCALRLNRRYGTRRVGWFLFGGLLLLGLTQTTQNLLSSGNVQAVAFLMLLTPVLLFIGVTWLDLLLKESVEKESQIERAREELKHRFDQQAQDLQQANAALKTEIAQREAHERSLEQSEAQYRLLFTENPFPMWVYDSKTLEFLTVNHAAEKHYGYTMAEFRKMTAKEMRHTDDVGMFLEQMTKLPKGQLSRWACRHRRKDGRTIEVEESGGDLCYNGIAARLVLISDLSDHRRLEEQLRHAQKMEAIGQLAGGVAHDFNNLLTVIDGHASLLQSVTKDPERKHALEQVIGASRRAASLTRQLLAFSRRQVVQPATIHPNELAQNVSKMLARLIGEDIRLKTKLATDLPCIHADPGMMEQVLMNLVVNGRDAIHSKGPLKGDDQISITTELVTVTETQTWRNRETRAGEFVCFRVLDTGCGMPPEMLPRLFEPFFTTKDIGKGTGLGLATVYGIVKQHSGWLEVDSKVGFGSQFRVFLPPMEKASVEASPPPSAGPAAIGGTETILLVEDEDLVRGVAKDILKRGGYQVIEANCGAAALGVWKKRSHEIDLVLTDMVMPGGMTGRQLAVELRRTKPNLKVLFVSGYSPSRGGGDINRLEGMRFIPKPYQPHQILTAIREQIDAKDTFENSIFARRLATHASAALR